MIVDRNSNGLERRALPVDESLGLLSEVPVFPAIFHWIALRTFEQFSDPFKLTALLANQLTKLLYITDLSRMEKVNLWISGPEYCRSRNLIDLT